MDARKRNYIIAIAAFLVFVVAAIAVILYIKERPGPDDYLKFQEAGRGHVMKGEWEKAAAEFEKAVKYGPDRFETHYDLGMTYMKLEKTEKALEEIKEAVRLNPKNMKVRYSLGAAYQRLRMFEEALKEYHEVAKSMSNSPNLFNNVGLIQLEAGDYDKAAGAFKHAIELKPDFYPAYINLGKAYEVQGEISEAKRVYQKMQKMASKRPETMPYAKAAEKRLAEISRQ